MIVGDVQQMELHYILEETRIDQITVRLYIVGGATYEVVVLQDLYRELEARTVFPEKTMLEALSRQRWLRKMARGMSSKWGTVDLDALESEGHVLQEFRHDSERLEPRSVDEFVAMLNRTPGGRRLIRTPHQH